MGVAEAGLILALTAAGISKNQATAAVFVQRTFTAHLPPIVGWFTLMWMRRRVTFEPGTRDPRGRAAGAADTGQTEAAHHGVKGVIGRWWALVVNGEAPPANGDYPRDSDL